jgi:regulator of CtrA degradation
VFERQRHAALSPLIGLAFSCESLKATTRIMHCIAWLLHRRAIDAGEVPTCRAEPLGYAPATDTDQLPLFDPDVQTVIAASDDLYFRLHRLAARIERNAPPPPPVHELLARISNAF